MSEISQVSKGRCGRVERWNESKTYTARNLDKKTDNSRYAVEITARIVDKYIIVSQIVNSYIY